MKSTGKASCILPHGVLFRGNAEGVIREKLVRSGYLKAIIGLPADLFYGTGIPACIVVLDKTNAAGRKGVFMIDASKGFLKDGPMNRLREQDVHRIVDTFTRQDSADPRFARMVPVDEITGAKNGFNLNLPRYIDSSAPEDLQDIDAHLRGGIPQRDVDDPVRLGPYWQVLPAVHDALFGPADRAGYCRLLLPVAEVKPIIFHHAEFAAFQVTAGKLFDQWKDGASSQLLAFDRDSHPKPLIGALSEDLLARFKAASLLRPYDIYQHLMDYWAATMQDDCYLISASGWLEAAAPHELLQVKNKDGKLVWAEAEDYRKGKRRFKSDLVPAVLLVARYFTAERDAIATLEAELASLEQQIEERRQKQTGEDGLLAEVVEGKGNKQKITAKSIKARLKEIGKDPEFEDEREALREHQTLLDLREESRADLRAAEEVLEAAVIGKYPTLTESEIKTLVIDDKWLATVEQTVLGELDRVSHTLTIRIRQLAERYAMSLPELVDELAVLSSKVKEHLRQRGAHERLEDNVLRCRCYLQTWI